MRYATKAPRPRGRIRKLRLLAVLTLLAQVAQRREDLRTGLVGVHDRVVAVVPAQEVHALGAVHAVGARAAVAAACPPAGTSSTTV